MKQGQIVLSRVVGFLSYVVKLCLEFWRVRGYCVECQQFEDKKFVLHRHRGESIAYSG